MRKYGRLPALNLVMVAALSILMTSCETRGNIETTTLAPIAGKAIFVMGANLIHGRIALIDGKLQNGVFSKSATTRMWPGLFEGMVTDGYVVGTVPADTDVGLDFILLESESSLSSQTYTTCIDELGARDPERMIPVFRAASGQVIYVGDIRFVRVAGGSLVPRFASNPDAAQAFLRSHYPNLTSSLQAAPFQLARCSGTRAPTRKSESK